MNFSHADGNFSFRTQNVLLLFRPSADILHESAFGGLKMDASEPRVRHRGFFLHSDTVGETDVVDHEHPEGFGVRVRTARTATPRHAGSSARGGRSASTRSDEGRPEIRSGSVTGSRQRAHLPR